MNSLICSLIIVTSLSSGVPNIEARQVHGTYITGTSDRWKVDFTQGMKAAKIDLFLNNAIQIVDDNRCIITQPSNASLTIP